MANENRLIDANGLLEKLKRTPRYFNVKFDIEEAPTVDAVEVVHGKWVSRKHENILGDFFRFHCSECGEDKPNSIHINYCPNCGAKMDGDGNENP